MVKGTFCILVSVVLFVPVAAALYGSITISPVERARRAEPFCDPSAVAPKPGERAVFLAGLVFLPASTWGLGFVCRRELVTRLARRWSPAARWIFDVGCGLLLAGGCWAVFAGSDDYHLLNNPFY